MSLAIDALSGTKSHSVCRALDTPLGTNSLLPGARLWNHPIAMTNTCVTIIYLSRQPRSCSLNSPFIHFVLVKTVS